MSSPGAPPRGADVRGVEVRPDHGPGVGSGHRALRAGPDRLARPRDLFVERLQRGEVDLREGGEGLDRVAQHVERDACADGKRRLLEPLPGLRAARVGAGQPVAVAEQREEAVRLGVGVRIGGGLATSDRDAVALKRASVAPTAAAWGSV